MNALIANPAELELMPDAAKASEAVVAEMDSASILETIRVRELTLTQVMEENFQIQPTSHWGINE